MHSLIIINDFHFTKLKFILIKRTLNNTQILTVVLFKCIYFFYLYLN